MHVPGINDSCSTSTSSLTQNNAQIENDFLAANYASLSEEVTQLTTKFDEFIIDQKKGQCDIKNLTKDNKQKILELEKSIRELSEISKRNSSTVVKNNIFLDFRNRSSVQALLIRERGFNPTYVPEEGGFYSSEREVMIQLASTFPKKFDLDIKGYADNRGTEPLIVHIGKSHEKLQSKQLSHCGNKDITASFEMENEEEGYDTIWISIPKACIQITLYSLNIVPLK